MTQVRNGRRVQAYIRKSWTSPARTHCAKRLLEHGPLTGREFVEITGWQRRTAYGALADLVKAGVALRDERVWRLA
jgi:predicted transcriptional regulator